MITLGQATVSLALRDVFKDGVALRIGTRAFDILELLIRHQGQLLSKEQILQCVWPDTVVEENNLQVHISALRKALGSDRDLIRTVPGRGYMLLGSEETAADSAGQDNSRALPLARNTGSLAGQHLPSAVELVGRDMLADEVHSALRDAHALITLIGPGGVGKTSLAVAVGRQWLERHQAPVHFVSLAELPTADHLPEALASVLGSGHSLDSLIRHLAERPGLIILDNCEHLIDPIAGFAEQLLQGAPGTKILATSREPLRIAAERSLQVPPLAIPEADATRAAILGASSAQLFLRHWRALDFHMADTCDAALDNYSVDLVGQVCRRLDGIPLALEMAAARACALGLYQLLESLDESMHLLAASRRTAPARQQTLDASLSWSYRLLSTDERAVLRLLADLDGPFTLEQACHALQRATLARSCIMDCMVRLATKSLLMVTAQGPFRVYRMLASTRACLRVVQTQEISGETLRLDPRYRATSGISAAFMAVPVEADRYHARHQRGMAANR